MESLAASGSRLGSLAQSARNKHLTNAKRILITVGVLTVLVNVGMLVFARTLVREQLDKELKAEGIAGLDPAKMEELIDEALPGIYLVQGAFLGIGVVFVILGLFMHAHPVLMTVLGLGIYIGSMPVMAVVDPTTLTRGIILKIIIIVALAKALTAARAAQREQAALEANESMA
jgi:hypothetical protein